MNYHNPENLTEWGQSDGWRIRLVGEPLPEDAECFHNGKWILAKNTDLPDWTYRTRQPLPGSPLIAQLDAEIKAKQELREIALAVEAGAEWEYEKPVGQWEKTAAPFAEAVKQGWNVRLKPKPVTRLWNKPSDLPPRPCYLRRKDGQSDDGWTMVLAANIHGVVIATGLLHDLKAATLQRIPWESLSDVLHSTDRINWKPCEVTEEAK